MSEKIKQAWEYIQDLLDVKGDVIMMAFSSAMIARIALSAIAKFPALTAAEAAAYASAVGSFAYSNKSPGGQA